MKTPQDIILPIASTQNNLKTAGKKARFAAS
jgi:hypothetical protein